MKESLLISEKEGRLLRHLKRPYSLKFLYELQKSHCTKIHLSANWNDQKRQRKVKMNFFDLSNSPKIKKQTNKQTNKQTKKKKKKKKKKWHFQIGKRNVSFSNLERFWKDHLSNGKEEERYLSGLLGIGRFISLEKYMVKTIFLSLYKFRNFDFYIYGKIIVLIVKMEKVDLSRPLES